MAGILCNFFNRHSKELFDFFWSSPRLCGCNNHRPATDVHVAEAGQHVNALPSCFTESHRECLGRDGEKDLGLNVRRQALHDEQQLRS